ncbi:MAG: ABC transporter substrate-binding protein [Proteobacteria bacterium]|nr:ABC transporter substrate-binding protein [Pseudomonadota bacterium]
MKTKLLAAGYVFIAAIFCLTGYALAEEGLTDTEIHIGQWGPQTGPAAPWGSVARGSDALFKLINDEGGIHGRKIVYHYFDDAYNPAKTKAGVKQLQESDHGIFAWVGGVGSAPGMAVKDYLMERKVPWITPAAGSLVWIDPPQRYLFPTYPLYIIEAKALVKYAKENMNKKRIAIVYQNDEYGKNGLRGAESQIAQYGMKLVASIPKNLADTDVKPHVAELRKSKADAVLLWVDPGSAARIVGTAAAMKFRPQFMSTSTVSDYPFMVKITRGLWVGVITAAFSVLPGDDHPVLNRYKMAYEKYAAKGERWGTFYIAGMSFAEPLVEALKNAGRNLSRERLVQELEKLEFQGSMGPVKYGKFDPNNPASRQGQVSVFIARCADKNGNAERLTDWIAPEYDWQAKK